MRGLVVIAAAACAAALVAVGSAAARPDAYAGAAIAASTCDLNASSWANRDDDGDGVCNGVDACPTEASLTSTACPMQAITVPEDAADPSVPHPTFSGASITLEGIARYGGDQFMWDFGDGSAPMPWTAVANPFDLGVQHTYTGAVGREYIATLSVRNSAAPSIVATATYPVEIEDTTAAVPTDPAKLAVRARMSVDRALWYLHVNAARSTFADGVPGYRQPYAVWPGAGVDEFSSRDCDVVDAFELAGHRPQGERSTDPYVEDVQSGLNTILASSGALSLTGSPADTNGNGVGVELGTFNSPSATMTGLVSSCLLALADSGAAGRAAATGPANVYNRPYGALGQDASEMLAAGQITGNVFDAGGWDYSLATNNVPDLDTWLWPLLALQASEHKLSTTTPPAVRSTLSTFLATHQNSSVTTPLNGGWFVFNNYYLPSMTAAGLVGERFLGQSPSSAAVQKGEGFLYGDWADAGQTVLGNATPSPWTANVGQAEAMQAVTRAFVGDGVSQVKPYDYTTGTQGAAGFDWFTTRAGQTQTGYGSALVAQQHADGSWFDWTGGQVGGSSGGTIATAQGVVVLTRDGSPVADAGGPYTTDVNLPVAFDASQSYDPSGGALTYEWDFDYDGSTFTVDATGATATFAQGYSTYTQTAAGVPTGTVHTAAVRVTSASGLQSIATVDVVVKPGAHPPVAQLSPVLGSVNVPVTLDASGSSDPDNDPLTFSWDTNNDGTFGDATGATTTVTFSLPGTYVVCVRVTDHPAQGTPSTVSACTTATIGAHAPVANAGGPYSGAPGSAVTLDGSGSSDPDGGTLTYAWDLTGNGLYTDSTAVKPTYTIPASAANGTSYPVCLKVKNASRTSNASCTTVTAVRPATPPTCSIVSPQIVRSNPGGPISITVDGSRSDGNGNPLTYSWSTDGPAFDSPTAAIATQRGTFTGAQVAWTDTLTLSNGFFTSSCSATVLIVDDLAPTLTVPANIVLEAGPSTTAQVADWLASATAADPAAAPGTTIPVANDFAGVDVGQTVTVTWTATNPYVGTVAQKSATVTVVDTTKPVLALPSDFTAASSHPTWTATALDFVDGAVPVTCTPASGSTFALGQTTVTCSAADSRGNTATGSFVVTLADATPPVIAATVTGPKGTRDWYIGDVTVSWSVADAESDVSATSGCTTTTLSTDTNGTTYTCTATSAGGTATQSVTVRRDTTPPTITAKRSPAANGAGWNNTDVIVSFDCSDGGSGIASCPAPSTFVEGKDWGVSAGAVDQAGNATGIDVLAIDVDETAPSLSGAPTTPPNGNGWYSGDVTIHWTCSDALSGIAGACPSDSAVTGEGAALHASASVADVAGNVTAADSAAVKIDRTAPTTGVSAPSGWTRSGVTVALSPHDNLSGVAVTHWRLDGGATQSGTSVVIDDEGAHTLTYWSVDQAGNVEAEQSVTVQIDKTAPTISHTVTPSPNTAGWNNTAVTVAFTCADPLSGIASCSDPLTLLTEGAGQPVTGTATDVAGNLTADTVLVSIDRTPPTVSATADRAPNANGWYGADVIVGFQCDDALSGVAACPAPVTLGEGRGQTASGTARDVAGNSGSGTLDHIDVDETNPVVTFTGASAYTVDETVDVTCAATDALSGIATSSCPSAHALASTYGLGPNTLSGTAIDRAGNRGASTFTFTVAVTCASLKRLIGQWVTDRSVVSGLNAKVDAICSSPNANAKRGQLGAFDNQLEAQTGKSVTAARAALLEQYAARL